MAIQSLPERTQPSRPTKVDPNNARDCQQQWLQVVFDPSSKTEQRGQCYQGWGQQPPLSSSSHAQIVAHQHRVQQFACQLSNETRYRYLNMIPVPLPLPTVGTRLEFLPRDVLNRICEYVDYEKLIWLYQESRTLNRIIDPQLAPYATKLSFVLQAERYFPQHYGAKPPNLGCYMCSKVLPASFFASNQPLQARLQNKPEEEQSVVNLRRFCIDCGIQCGCHCPGGEINTRTGDRFWLCNCLRMLSDKTTDCMTCGAFSPSAPRRRRERLSLDIRAPPTTR
ncbi:hypothetical protein GGR54DRAFT_321489 [Hypoxylon sp. NC1633]|nr:hypothetical protein GGR54DRAFT_321489 [Hypoxylon sp. NC1633]